MKRLSALVVAALLVWGSLRGQSAASSDKAQLPQPLEAHKGSCAPGPADVPLTSGKWEVCPGWSHSGSVSTLPAGRVGVELQGPGPPGPWRRDANTLGPLCRPSRPFLRGGQATHGTPIAPGKSVLEDPEQGQRQAPLEPKARPDHWQSHQGLPMRVGSLFSGYGGLDLAVGGDLAWYCCEVGATACKVMEAHHPGVPNLGDITKVNWSDVPPVDVITGGYPCQPFSTAGHRKGTNDERHLWPYVREALRHLQPNTALLENVRGHITLGLDSVVTDLAGMGWSARWGVVRASDAGAPHQRAQGIHPCPPQWSTTWALAGLRSGGQPGHQSGRPWSEPSGHSGSAVSRGGSANPAHPQGHSHRPPVPERGQPEQPGGSDSQAAWRDWQAYWPAIQRWEHITGRPAPAPVVTTPRGQRLSPYFVEWMMGLEPGWVTGHGLTAPQELKMLGNGVVPQQARLALVLLVQREPDQSARGPHPGPKHLHSSPGPRPQSEPCGRP